MPKSQERHIADFKLKFLLLFFCQMWIIWNLEKNMAFAILYFCDFDRNCGI